MDLLSGKSKRLFGLGSIQIAEEVIQGSIYLDINVDGDMNWLDLYWFEINFMAGATRYRQHHTGKEERSEQLIISGHFTYSPLWTEYLYHT